MYKNHVISTKNELRTSPFGMRKNPTGAGTQMHKGIDLVDAQRLERTQDVFILAFADGVVALAKTGSPSLGNYVDIAHDFGGRKYLTRYFHMKNGSLRVKTGQAVKKGDILGIMGTTGDSTGIHLHFQINENSTYQTNGIPIDPEPYLLGEKSFAGQNYIGGVQAAQTVQSAPAKTQRTQGANSTPFKVNDRVKIKQFAKNYTGASPDVPIPNRVKTLEHTIMQVSKDGRSVLLEEIYSWVWTADIEKA